MGFSEGQVRALGRSVSSRNIRTRVSAGKELTYIEGWYALAQANRIFGFDGWDRETVETKCVQQRETRGHCAAVYSARVRITVRAGDRVIVRDGHGTGEAHGDSPGEVHDRGLKAAETDATKRALATFGKAFGLALYAGTGRRPDWNGKRPSPPPAPQHEASAAGPFGPVDRSPATAVAPAVPNGETIGHTANGDIGPGVLENSEGSPDVATGSVPPAPIREAGAHNERARLNGSAGRAKTAIAQPTQSRVDKSVLALSEPRRLRDKEHLRFVASQPCLLCSALPSDAHHLRSCQPRALGRKVGDDFTVPLCRQHHRDLHDSGNEAAWWHDMGIDALEIAKDLWNETVTGRL